MYFSDDRSCQEEYRNLTESLESKGNNKTQRFASSMKMLGKKLLYISACRRGEFSTPYFKKHKIPISEQNFPSDHRKEKSIVIRSLDPKATQLLQRREETKEVESAQFSECRAK
jgi:hypothetical protein